jgi:hypothetical protein
MQEYGGWIVIPNSEQRSNPAWAELVESARGYWAAEGLRVTDATLYSSGGSPPSMMAAPLPCGLGRGRSTDEQRDSMGWSSPATLRGTS